MKGDIDSSLLQHGAPWRDFPRNDGIERRRQWAKIQMMDFVEAFADTEFGVWSHDRRLLLFCVTFIGSIEALISEGLLKWKIELLGELSWR